MQKKTIGIVALVTAVVAVSGGLAAASSGFDAINRVFFLQYEGDDLKRDVDKQFTQVAQNQEDLSADVYRLLKKDAEDQKTKVLLIKSDYELQGKPVPEFVVEEIAKQDAEIRRLERKIEQLSGPSP